MPLVVRIAGGGQNEEYSGPAIDRLAVYEDTGLEPEEAQKLADAKREGRLVMLPCKVGTPVYRIGAGVCKWREIDRCNDYCSGYEYEDCWEGGLEVLKEKFCFEMLGKVGKTVFLTREEAEAALEAQKGGTK